MGISREPWAVMSTQSPTMFFTRSAGKVPPFLLASRVRSPGAILSAPTAGPLPLPSSPWQALQRSMKMSRPLGEIAGFFFAAMFEAQNIVSATGIITLQKEMVSLDIEDAPLSVTDRTSDQ